MKVIKYIILYLVPVPVPTFLQVTFPGPVPIVKSYGSYGSGSGSTTLPTTVEGMTKQKHSYTVIFSFSGRGWRRR
jgi:hypothetical protein